MISVETVENSVEDLIITGMIVDTRFFREIQRAAKPEYFSSDISKILVFWLRDYFFANGCNSPGEQIKEIYELNKGELDSDEAVIVRLFLKKISEEYSGRIFNTTYVLPKALKHLEKNAYEYKIKKIANELKKDNLDAAKLIFHSTSKEIFEEVTQWKSLSDEELLHSWWDKKKESAFSFPGALGRYLPKIERGRLYAMLGPPKRGKTFWLLEWAYNAAIEGLNTVVFSLEMPEDEIDSRWKEKLAARQIMEEKSSIYKIPVLDCKHNQTGECSLKKRKSKIVVSDSKSLYSFEEHKKHKPCIECKDDPSIFIPSHWIIEKEFPRLTRKEAERKQKAFDHIAGKDRVRIKSFPISTATVEDLENSLNELEMNTGFIPDMVVVDYADIIKEDLRLGEKRHRIGDIWKQLSRMAKIRNVVLVTASQGTKLSDTKNRLEKGDAAEDWSKIMTIDGLFAINEQNYEKANQYQTDKYWQIQRIETLTLRYGKFIPGRHCVVFNDLDRGQICIDSYINYRS